VTLDFLPPDGMTLEGAGGSLAGALDVLSGPVREADQTFYDTFDGLLRAAGLTLVHEDGQLSLLEHHSGTVRASLSTPPPTKPLLAIALREGPFRDALLPVVDVRAVLPLVHIHTRERAIYVLDEERKTVVRMALSQPALVERGVHTALRPRLRVSPVRGYAEELEHVRSALEHELGFAAADQQLLDEAVRAAGGVPGGISSKLDIALRLDQRADSAAVVVLRRLLEVIEANLDGAIADIDSEFLHDLRVSVRRSRAVQRELRGVFAAEELAHFREEFRWLQQVTGDARDLDVYALDFESFRAMVHEQLRPDLDPLLAVLKRRRARAHQSMVRALRSKRASLLLADWRAFLDGLEESPRKGRPDADRPIAQVSGERIHKVYARMLRMGGAIGPDSPAADYHELRKKGKELRYLLELFAAALYPGEVVKPMIRALKALQDVLGRHQDREIQVGSILSLAAEVGGPNALIAMGALVQRLREDEAAARSEFAGRFAAFASPDERRLVKETFG
jgi:CHAD domain-containing protein